jgi:hypothetical protein
MVHLFQEPAIMRYSLGKAKIGFNELTLCDFGYLIG